MCQKWKGDQEPRRLEGPAVPCTDAHAKAQPLEVTMLAGCSSFTKHPGYACFFAGSIHDVLPALL